MQCSGAHRFSGGQCLTAPSCRCRAARLAACQRTSSWARHSRTAVRAPRATRCLACGGARRAWPGQCVTAATCTLANCATLLQRHLVLGRVSRAHAVRHRPNTCSPCGWRQRARRASAQTAGLSSDAPHHQRELRFGSARRHVQAEHGRAATLLGGYCTLPCSITNTSCGAGRPCRAEASSPRFTRVPTSSSARPNCSVRHAVAAAPDYFCCYQAATHPSGGGSAAARCLVRWGLHSPTDRQPLHHRLSLASQPAGRRLGFCITAATPARSHRLLLGRLPHSTTTNHFCCSNGLCVRLLPDDGGMSPDFLPVPAALPHPARRGTCAPSTPSSPSPTSTAATRATFGRVRSDRRCSLPDGFTCKHDERLLNCLSQAPSSTVIRSGELLAHVDGRTRER